MKTFLVSVALTALLMMMAGCSSCRWPWQQRTVTTAMPPATCPCGSAGPAVVQGDACGAPALTGPVTTTVLPPGTAGAPSASVAPSLPAPQPYAPSPGTTYAPGQ